MQPNGVPSSLPSTRVEWETLLVTVFDKKLSDRQRQSVAGHIVGLSDPQIGADLGIAPATVRTYVDQVLAQLDLSSVRQLPLACFEHIWRHYHPPS